jgi:hypothetical protein
MAKAGSQSPVNGAGVEELGFPGLKTWATEKERDPTSLRLRSKSRI